MISTDSRTCIIVVGMHRSGTSALAGTLGLLGAALPNNMLGATGSNPKGHFESAAVLGINKQILSALNTCWYDFCNIELGSLDSRVYNETV